MPSTATKDRPVEVKPRERVATADSYLGVVSKLVTILAALGTLSIWLYSSFYVGSLEIRPSEKVDAITIKLYNDRGVESVYKTEHVKVLPGRYRVVVESPESKPEGRQVDIRFNGTTVIPYMVQASEPVLAPQEKEPVKANRRWWQLWKRN